MCMDDQELLGAYVDGRDEGAFAQLVRLHGEWVQAAAQRQLRDRHLAEDAAQAVFLLLVRRAKGLRGRSELGGWLFQAVRYCVRETKRHRSAEQRREQEVAKMRHEEIRQEADWEEISPLLDDAVGKLGKADREVVLLRFYQQKAMAEVGEALGLSEEAAKKRVQRAVGKLREKLSGKGVAVEAGSLGAMVLAHAAGGGMEGGAAGLVEKVMAGIGGGGGGNGTAGLIAKGAEKMMVWTKVKVAAVLLLCAVGVGAGAVALSQVAPGAARPAMEAKAATVAGGDVGGRAQVYVETRIMTIEKKLLPPEIYDPATKQWRSGFVDEQQVEALVRSALPDQEGRVVTAPRVTVDDGGDASVDVATLHQYRDVKATTRPDGSQEYSPTRSDTWDGIRQNITAKTDAGHQVASIKFQLTIQKLLGMEKVLTKPTNPNDKPIEFELPQLQTMHIDTNITVPSGKTALISGQEIAVEYDGRGKVDVVVVVLVKPVIITTTPKDNGQGTGAVLGGK